MTRRLNAIAIEPAAYKAMMALESYVQSSTLDHGLLHLVKLRASYMNGCAYCIDMHSKDARAGGETEQRVYSVPVWREAPYYTDRERAAFAWTEAVTSLGHDGVRDDVYSMVRSQFSEVEIVQLTMAVVAINGWNRLSIALGSDVGSYQVPHTKNAR